MHDQGVDDDPGTVSGRRRPRRSAIVVCLALSVASAVAGVAWTPLAFLAIPFLGIAAYGMWLGLRNDELLDVMGSTSEDSGTGPAGLH